MKASAVSTITKSLPIGFPTLVNYSLLATLGYINLFYINFKEYNSGIIGVTILGDVNKIYLLHGVPQSRIPEQYFEYHNKLFYWYDNKKSAHSNILKKLSDYKVVDSVSSITDEMGNIRDEKKKGMNYFFCKENLLIYRKEKTSIALPRDFKMDLDCK